MPVIPFVRKEHAAVAREIEQRLMELPADSGVIFAGVAIEATTTPDQEPVYRLTLGVDRELKIDATAYDHLVTLTLQGLLLVGVDIQVVVKRGVVRG